MEGKQLSIVTPNLGDFARERQGERERQTNREKSVAKMEGKQLSCT